MTKVIVLGGGVAGMTAAHELRERGFDVVVYEKRGVAGGKARSIRVPGTGKGGRPDLPGEHGFRFFPGFYRHVPDTMQRIPGRNGGTVFEDLTECPQGMLARADGHDVIAPAHFPTNLTELHQAVEALYAQTVKFGIPFDEQLHFVNCLLRFLTSCKERRLGEYEQQSWWEFAGAQQRSQQYRKFLADGLTRSLVAAKAHRMSARTGGAILLQLLFDLVEPGQQVDRVLAGPTNDVWIDPWLAELQRLGVDYRAEVELQQIRCDGKRITGVTLVRHDRLFTDRADYYVAALPVEVMRAMVRGEQRLAEAEPRLIGLECLVTAWMNGIQFYLDRKLDVVKGHTLYIDSPWALTSISQGQFWPCELQPDTMGDGAAKAILSVDVSDWEAPGLYGKPAMHCSPEQVVAEVWDQLKASLDDDAIKELIDARLLGWWLDDSIQYPNPREAVNLEPLLVNTAGSWNNRPHAVTAIPNLFLASDYVRTYTDLATMEGANEAARHAVNGILAAEGSDKTECKTWPLDEPGMFAPLRAFDRALYALHQPQRDLVSVRAEGTEVSPLLSVGRPVAGVGGWLWDHLPRP